MTVELNKPYADGDPRMFMADWEAMRWTCGDGSDGDHTFGDHPGEYCQCAGCEHPQGVCIDVSSGGGCAACEGPVSGCDFSAKTLHETEPDMYDKEGFYIGHLAEGGSTDARTP